MHNLPYKKRASCEFWHLKWREEKPSKTEIKDIISHSTNSNRISQYFTASHFHEPILHILPLKYWTKFVSFRNDFFWSVKMRQSNIVLNVRIILIPKLHNYRNTKYSFVICLIRWLESVTLKDKTWIVAQNLLFFSFQISCKCTENTFVHPHLFPCMFLGMFA